MAEEVKFDVIKKTQTALNKYIKKPPLTEKLLKKPPFRFLHDIITAVIRETGFLRDVFTAEELVADNVKDRDSKVKFLTKLINALKETTGIQIKAKPGKIVAGLEVDKTHELLQALAKGIYLQKNGKKSQESVQKEKKKPNEVIEVVDNKVENNVETEKNSPSQPPPEPAAEIPLPTEETPNTLPPEDQEVGEKKKRERKKSSAGENGETKERKRRDKSGKDDKKRKEELKRRESFPLIQNGDGDNRQEDNTERLVNGVSGGPSPNENSPLERKSSSRHLKKGESGDSQEKADTSKPEETNSTSQGTTETKEDTKKRDETGSGDAPQPKRPTTRRASTRSSRQPLKALAEKDIKEEDNRTADTKSDTKRKTEKHSALPNAPLPGVLGSVENPPPSTPQVERPRTARRPPPSARPPSARPPSARPRSARPPSALPSAPKTRDRGNVETDINKDRAESEIKEVAVIIENEKEEKEEMVVVESQTLPLVEDFNERDDMTSTMEGVLIDTILETQSELEKKQSGQPQLDIEWENISKGKKEAWQKECERLRQGVQALTRAAGPLGKLFDFLQEDVDLAAREMMSWRDASSKFTSQLDSEQRLTEETLSRHKKKLTEIEGLIEEQHDAIRSIKASILTNDKKIQSLIARVPSAI